MAVKLVQKLTPRSMGWDRNLLGSETAKVPMDGGRVLIGRIVGVIVGLKETVDKETSEIFTGLKGSFRGISSRLDKDTGVVTVVDSGVMYLPAGIQAVLEAGLATAQETDPKATVQFAFDLFGIPSTNKAGYSFDADILVDPSKTDPLANLIASADAFKALPAPEKTETAPATPAADAEKTTAKTK